MSVDQISVIEVTEVTESDETKDEQNTRANIPNSFNWKVFHIFTILGASVLSLSPQLIIPRHNTIFYPSFWYEGIALWGFPMLIVTMRTMLEIFIFTKEKKFVSVIIFVKMYLCYFIPLLFYYMASHYYWTTVLELVHPIPFTWIILVLVAYNFNLLIPLIAMFTEYRKNDEVKSRLKAYVIYQLWWFFINIQRDVLIFAFKSITKHLQFIVVMMVPILKEINKKILSGPIKKVLGADDEMSNIFLGIRLNIHYALIIATRMTGAETFTVIIVIIMDCLMQLLMTKKIVTLYKKVEAEGNTGNNLKKEKEKVINKLLLAELIEGLVPISYTIGVSMAFYGPNRHIIGNVGTDLWAYEKIDNFFIFFTRQFSLFGIDIISVLLNTYLLLRYANVNLMQEFQKVISTYWIFLAIQLANTLSVYFVGCDINLGTDNTGKFEWITKDGRLNYIMNSTDLSDDERISLLANRTIS